MLQFWKIDFWKYWNAISPKIDNHYTTHIMRVTTNKSFIRHKYLYSSVLLPELFPNSFLDVNTVCSRDPPGKPSGTKEKDSRGVPEAVTLSSEKKIPRWRQNFFSTTWSSENLSFITSSENIRYTRIIWLSNPPIVIESRQNRRRQSYY